MKNEKTLKWSLAACRVNEQMTQLEASEKLHMSIATLNGHENGKVKPSYAQLMAYSQLYGVPIGIIDCETRN